MALFRFQNVSLWGEQTIPLLTWVIFSHFAALNIPWLAMGCIISVITKSLHFECIARCEQSKKTHNNRRELQTDITPSLPHDPLNHFNAATTCSQLLRVFYSIAVWVNLSSFTGVSKWLLRLLYLYLVYLHLLVIFCFRFVYENQPFVNTLVEVGWWVCSSKLFALLWKFE